MSPANRRKLRLAPRHVMTGDVLVERAYEGGTVEILVTEIDPTNNNRGWTIGGITTGGKSAAYYANQRRLDIVRTGPKGLGE